MGDVDLALVRPGDQKRVYGQLSGSLSAIEPPLWAALCAAYVRDRGISVRILDIEAEGLSPEQAASTLAEWSPTVVGFIVIGNNLSASTWNMDGATAYHEALHQVAGGIPTFFWGLHPSALPERTLRNEGADYVCKGDDFDTVVRLVEVIKESGNAHGSGIPGLNYLDEDSVLVSWPQATPLKNLDELPTPAWDLLPMRAYRAHNWHCFHDLDHRQPYGVVYASLGCPFDCSFCSLNKLFAGKPGVRFRSPEKVVEDIAVLVERYGVKNIKVLDECFVLKERYVLEICDRIIERGYDLNMWAYSRVDTVNEQMLERMRSAGMRWLAYGIESGSRASLDVVHKGRYGAEEIHGAIRMTKAAGIWALGNYMFGLPDDDSMSMQDTLSLAKDLACEYANFYVTMAYPGSRLYEDALRDGTRLPTTWRGYSQFSRETLPLPTLRLTSEEVLRFRDEAFVEYFNDPAYQDMMRRTFGEPAVEAVREMLSHSIERDILIDGGARPDAS